jgi:hypothetical protein
VVALCNDYRMKALPLLLTLSLFMVAPLPAFEPPTQGQLPRAEARYTPRPPVIDGKWSRDEWSAATPIPFPSDAAHPNPKLTDGGEVRVLWNEAGVYIAFRAIDQTPIQGGTPNGDPLYQEDVFEIFIDQSADHLQWYEIQIDMAGRTYIKNHVVTTPLRLTPEGRLTQEYVLSELWRYAIPQPESSQVASVRDPHTGQWTVELFLPASFVHRRAGGGPMTPCTWRVNFARHDWTQPIASADRKPRFLYWAPVLPGHPHLSPTLMGYLKLKKS